jgi:hypothetical protein
MKIIKNDDLESNFQSKIKNKISLLFENALKIKSKIVATENSG